MMNLFAIILIMIGSKLIQGILKMVEISITVKGNESTFKQDIVVYEDFQFNKDDPVIKKYVKEVLGNAKIEPERIRVRALLELS